MIGGLFHALAEGKDNSVVRSIAIVLGTCRGVVEDT